MRRLLERKIDALPLAFRAAFMLREVEEMTIEEAAECLGIPQATVRTRVFRARALLRASLAEELDVATGDVFRFAGARCDRIVAGVLARLGRSADAAKRQRRARPGVSGTGTGSPAETSNRAANPSHPKGPLMKPLLAVAAAASIAFFCGSAAAQSPSDAQIAAIVVTANQVDIDAGKLAESKAQQRRSEGVRQADGHRPLGREQAGGRARDQAQGHAGRQPDQPRA